MIWRTGPSSVVSGDTESPEHTPFARHDSAERQEFPVSLEKLVRERRNEGEERVKIGLLVH
jgi:hypothetical protein